MYKSEIEDIHAINRYMQEHIDNFYKGSESCAAHQEHVTTHFNNVANITINSDSITPQKKMGEREIVINIMRFLLTKTRQIRV